MKQIYLSGIVLFALIVVFASSCIKEDEYKKFLEEGEIVYAGRADSVIAQSGNERIRLRIVLGNDPNVSTIKAYWNNRRDSAEMLVERTPDNDTVNMVIDELAEGNYNFAVYTYDQENNSSVAVNVTGYAYGESYINSLVNRRLDAVDYSSDGQSLQFHWGRSLNNEAYTELHYTDRNENGQTLTVLPDDTLTEIPDHKENGEITYRSFFKPDTTAYEFFYTEITNVTLPKFERALSKAGFKDFSLPTDIKDGGYGWLIEYLWDDNFSPPGFATQSGVPQWFTIDLGVSTTLSKLKIWQANDRLYAKESVKKFEVWGSDNPDMDGSWDSWTKLMTCESVKPSGLPVGENSGADIEYAAAGEEFVFTDGTPKIRYLRLKLLENWGNSSFMTIAELSLWTTDR